MFIHNGCHVIPFGCLPLFLELFSLNVLTRWLRIVEFTAFRTNRHRKLYALLPSSKSAPISAKSSVVSLPSVLIYFPLSFIL